MVSGNSKFHENFGTGNCDLTIFSIVQQGALQIIGTHRKFKQVCHYKRTCVREAKVIYNIKKATVFVIHQLRNVNWTSNGGLFEKLREAEVDRHINQLSSSKFLCHSQENLFTEAVLQMCS